MQFRPTALALAVVGLVSQAQAQQAAPAAEPQKIERVEVTGSMIKRTDKETPSVVQVITADDIKNSGYASVEDLLRGNSAVDLGSISDGAGSGFVSGVATISMRGFGSQGTLILINGRRIAPAGVVDFNFGRANMVNVNTIPKSAIERIEILKDGASAIYGSDAMAGVVNYVLKKEYQGADIGVTTGANSHGAGRYKSGNATFGFGNLDTQKFNVFGGIDLHSRDPVYMSQLKNVGDLAGYDAWNAGQSILPYFFPASRNTFAANYYKVPPLSTSSTTNSANTNVDGASYLGTLPGCPDELTVGKGVPTKSPVSTATYPVGQCRFNVNEADQIMSKQDRVSAAARANFLVNNDTTAFIDVMASQTKTKEDLGPRALTTSLRTANDLRATSWPTPTGQIMSQNSIILPIGHPDNPTNGTANSQAVQLLYRFSDIARYDISTQRSLRVSTGVNGFLAGWDYDAALMYSRAESESVSTGSLLKAGVDAAISATGSAYRFGKVNTPAAIASIAADATNNGKAEVTSIDARASRELFDMAGGKAAIALGVEGRRETFEAVPDANFKAGNFVSLLANEARGNRTSFSAFSELRLPVTKSLEAQAALRGEHYSDFGNATTGKLGFKWNALPSMLAIRGTAATGFRAPAISQTGNGFSLSFNSGTNAERVFDPVRCDRTDPLNPVSRSVQPNQWRDCNVLNFTTSIPAAQQSGSIATLVTPNPDLKPETSRSFTAGFILSPTNNVDLSIDAWYFKRNDEIRVYSPLQVMQGYLNDLGNPDKYIIRDPNQGTWLPGVTNSGPILAVKRRYDNFQYTVTSGIDYELNIRLPANEFGKFKVKLEGTYTNRYDRKVDAKAAVERLVGTTTTDIPKTKASIRLDWSKADWNAWGRVNHSDALYSLSTSPVCDAAPSSNTQYTIPRENGWCRAGLENTLDLGVGYKGFKNLRLSFFVLNATNAYDFANTASVPAAPTYYYQGTQGQLGRRWSISANYSFN